MWSTDWSVRERGGAQNEVDWAWAYSRPSCRRGSGAERVGAVRTGPDSHGASARQGSGRAALLKPAAEVCCAIPWKRMRTVQAETTAGESRVDGPLCWMLCEDWSISEALAL